jgi:malonyl-CoA decarboxylase
MPASPPSDLKPERGWLERLWSSIADRAPRGPAPASERARLLAEALLSERGEASGAAVAQELQTVLQAATPEDRLAFYRFVATHFEPDPARLRAAAEAYLADPTPDHAGALAEAAEPIRQELLRRANMAPGGTAALVAMRAELLTHLRADPSLQPLDADLRHLFGSWFNRGFLQLRRIDWQTPAAVLEKLIAYEAVHEIDGWADLRRRLAPDRRCFGFFHPALPGEPLIFVEVALTTGLATAIAALLEPEPADAAARARAADTAIFYSISNCQDGLRGISFGNFLIKQVVAELKAELPQLTRFSTLSPVPGFSRWLEQNPVPGLDLPQPATPPDESLRLPLTQACARYLTRPAAAGARIDPVARFHLGNGARLERIDWAGNLSARGLAESRGIMVNYLYDPATIEANHEAFARDGAIIRSPEVESLLTQARPRRRSAASA